LARPAFAFPLVGISINPQNDSSLPLRLSPDLFPAPSCRHLFKRRSDATKTPQRRGPLVLSRLPFFFPQIFQKKVFYEFHRSIGSFMVPWGSTNLVSSPFHGDLPDRGKVSPSITPRYLYSPETTSQTPVENLLATRFGSLPQ